MSDNVFGLDIGTRNVVGTVGYKTEDEKFVVVAQYSKQHETRAMLDGQIHDIARVARTIGEVKAQLEQQTGEDLQDVCIAAAGRVLKTVTVHVDYEYPEPTTVTEEDVQTLHLLGVEKAQDQLNEKNDTHYHFFCVGYSTVRYYMNDDLFIALTGHKASKIGEDIIVTFLPEDVVDGLYSAVGLADMNVANMTLEPIAAIDVAIPENFRMLNLALVDVGAGTSDICVTKDGSIIAYGMIPHAGDELTETLVQHYLIDFKTAETLKLGALEGAEIPFTDIMLLQHTATAEEIWGLLDPVVDKITAEVADKIKELNGGKSVSACFVVGGGGKVHGFTEKLAEHLGLPKERVALRGEEVLGEVTFLQEEIKKDPLLVTPIGICLNYYEQKNNFIMVRFNGRRLKIYDNNRLTVVDAALVADFPKEDLFPKRGNTIRYTLNGNTRTIRGTAGEPAVITLNGEPANINTPLAPNSEVEIVASTSGEPAVLQVKQLEEYGSSTISFVVNGKEVTCSRFVEVNGSLEPGGYSIQDGDVIVIRNYYTLEQIAAFMDVEVDQDQPILVNNKNAEMDAVVYENFSVDFTVKENLLASEDQSTYNATESASSKEAPVFVGVSRPHNAPEVPIFAKSDVFIETPSLLDPYPMPEPAEPAQPADFSGNARPSAPVNEAANSQPTQTAGNSAEEPQTEEENGPLYLFVNNAPLALTGKKSYIFVDVFDFIDFDLKQSHGRAIVTQINGRDANYTEALHNGDKVDIYWKEN